MREEPGQAARRTRFLLWLSTVSAALAFGTVAVYLALPAAEVRDVALVLLPRAIATNATPVELAASSLPESLNVHRQRLKVAHQPVADAPGSESPFSRLALAQNLSFLMATYGASPILRSATAHFTGTTCVLRAPPEAELRDNALLTLVPDAICQNLGKGAVMPADSELDLEIISQGAAHISLWSYIVKGPTPVASPAFLALQQPQEPNTAVYPVGQFRPQPLALHLRHSQVLAYLWDGQGSAAELGIYGVLCFGFLLAVAAAWGTLSKQQPVAFCLVFVAAGCTFAVITPPFQAPDEPNHFLSFARDTGANSLADDALRLANLGHFERIKFRPLEKFVASDTTTPAQAGWASHIWLTDSHRSYTAVPIWVGMSKLLGVRSAAFELLAMRWLNVLFVAACMAIGYRLSRVPKATPTAGLTGLLAVAYAPSVPFFAMHVSNYPFLVGAVALQAQCLEGLLDNRQSWRTGLGIGIGTALSVYGGNAGVGILAFWAPLAFALACGLWTEEIPPATTGSRMPLFVAALLGHAGVAGLVHWYWHGDLKYQSLGLLAGIPFPQVAIIIGLTLLIVATSRWWRTRLRRLIGAESGAFAGFWRSVAVLIILGFIGSMFLSARALPSIEIVDGPKAITALKYVRRAVQLFFLGQGYGSNDVLVVKTFWFGFGWLEVFPSDALLWLLRFAVAAGLVIAGLGLWPVPRWPAVRAWTAYAGVACFVGVLAWAYYRSGWNLHGRYLLFPYVLTFTIALTNVRTFMVRLGQSQALAAATIVVLGVSYGWIWLFLAQRYY